MQKAKKQLNLNQTGLYLKCLLMVAVFALASCGGGLSEDDAEDALRAAFEGDAESASEHFCASEPMPVDENVLPANVVFKEVSCEQQGADRMSCTTTFEKDGAEDRVVMVFKIEEDQLCDGTVE